MGNVSQESLEDDQDIEGYVCHMMCSDIYNKSCNMSYDINLGIQLRMHIWKRRKIYVMPLEK